jgi:hypothetical protein
MRCSAFGLAAVLAAGPLLAHHLFSAEFDDKKPVTLKGVVTRFEWSDPHVFIDLDVKGAGGAVTSWSVELESPIELRKIGWTRDSVKIGDVVTADASSARDGSKQAGAKSVVLASGKKMSGGWNEALSVSRGGQASKPTPRWPDGRPRLGTVPGEKGYWANPSAGSMVETSAGNIRMNRDGLLANIADAGKVAPFQPWAKGLYEYRQRAMLKDDPMISCLPSGGPRQFQDPIGLVIVEQPDRKRMFVFSGGANRNWRLIYLDGRPLPTSEDESPTYFGYSGGSWDGDTLVVKAVLFNERFWFSNGGLPHTENLKLTERISRPDFNTLKYEVSVDDPGAYTRTWSAAWTLQWVPNADIEEYFCQDNNRDPEHLAGK